MPARPAAGRRARVVLTSRDSCNAFDPSSTAMGNACCGWVDPGAPSVVLDRQSVARMADAACCHDQQPAQAAVNRRDAAPAQGGGGNRTAPPGSRLQRSRRSNAQSLPPLLLCRSCSQILPNLRVEDVYEFGRTLGSGGEAASGCRWLPPCPLAAVLPRALPRQRCREQGAGSLRHSIPRHAPSFLQGSRPSSWCRTGLLGNSMLARCGGAGAAQWRSPAAELPARLLLKEHAPPACDRLLNSRSHSPRCHMSPGGAARVSVVKCLLCCPAVQPGQQI